MAVIGAQMEMNESSRTMCAEARATDTCIGMYVGYPITEEIDMN